jgi:hypothetical protein
MRDAVASRLGLSAYAWLSPEYVQDSLDDLKDQFPSMLIIPE